MIETAPALDILSAVLKAQGGLHETALVHGTYTAELFDASGTLLWREVFDNIVCTVGKNLALNAYLGPTNPYTLVGPFLGLISSASFSAVSATDTMTSHTGWLEAGGANAPTYSGSRASGVFAGATGGSNSFASAASFTFTGSGNVQGAFLTLGPGALNTIDSTAGTLYSAGTFATAQPVIPTNVLQVNYTAAM